LFSIERIRKGLEKKYRVRHGVQLTVVSCAYLNQIRKRTMLNQSNPQLIRRQQVELMTGLKRSSIYGRMNPQCKQYDPDFPKPVSLSTGGKGRLRGLLPK
jgi:prophage regulatory protein